MMKHFQWIFALTTLLLTSLSFAATSSHSQSFLFIQTAPQATLTATTLTLEHVGHNTLWFTDRPKRAYGFISTAQFVQLWITSKSPQSFNAIPPNAASVDATLQANQLQIVTPHVLVLSHPVYDSSKNTLTYTVKYLDPTKAPSKPQNVQEVNLFIDQWTTPSTPPEDGATIAIAGSLF